MTNSLSALRTTQMRYCCWNLVSTPKPKSDGVTDSEDGAWFKDGSRKEEAQKHQEAGRKEAAHRRPNDGAAHLIDRIGRHAFDSLALGPCRSANTGLAAALGFSGDADAFGAGGVAVSAVVFTVCFSSPSTFWFAS